MNSQHPGLPGPARRAFLGGSIALGAVLARPGRPVKANPAPRRDRAFRVSLSVSPFTEAVPGSLSLTDGCGAASTVNQVQQLFNRHGATEVFTQVATFRSASSAMRNTGSPGRSSARNWRAAWACRSIRNWACGPCTATAAGNPLFITELIGAISQEGAIKTAGGRAEVTEMTLPPTLRLTILRRLSFLPAETLQALRAASILGSGFSLTDLATVAPTASGPAGTTPATRPGSSPPRYATCSPGAGSR